MDYNLWQNLILGATSPFRKGANILAQNWGSALTGKDMSKSENQGKFLQYLASSLTPGEQEQITNEPYLESLKSSAGMTSTLMPYTKIGSVANIGDSIANQTLSKLAQLIARGSVEGSVGGFGYSRPGEELQDTLLGTALGTGGEIVGGLIGNPTFRKGIGQELTKANSGKYEAMLDLSGKNTKQSSTNKGMTFSELAKMAKKESDNISDDIFSEEGVALPSGYTGLKISGKEPRFTDYKNYLDEDDLITLLRMGKDSQNRIGEKGNIYKEILQELRDRGLQI